MKILAVTSGKGGVGKTTLSLNIARQLSLHGLRTVILDFDIHNKGATGLFLDKITDSSSSIISIVEKSKNFEKALAKEIADDIRPVELVEDGSLLLVPAASPREMIQWSRFVASNEEIVAFFRELIEELTANQNINVVVIDCYGGIDSLTVAAAGIADDTIIVNEADLITFSGTLMLYKYLASVYADSELKPGIHFVINRITSRHSFRFLDREYKEHLAGLAISNSILAYFQHDELIMETFGDYAFFTELLPKSLITKKIKLLIHKLWDEKEFSAILKVSKRKEKKIYRQTSEKSYADPSRILQILVSVPYWIIIPATILVLLGALAEFGSLDQIMWDILIIGLGLTGTIATFLWVFILFQISRWLLRGANYKRRRRVLREKKNRLFHHSLSIFAYIHAIIPVIIALYSVLVYLLIFVTVA